jgi:hypothetical protein
MQTVMTDRFPGSQNRNLSRKTSIGADEGPKIQSVANRTFRLGNSRVYAPHCRTRPPLKMGRFLNN